MSPAKRRFSVVWKTLYLFATECSSPLFRCRYAPPCPPSVPVLRAPLQYRLPSLPPPTVPKAPRLMQVTLFFLVPAGGIRSDAFQGQQSRRSTTMKMCVCLVFACFLCCGLGLVGSGLWAWACELGLVGLGWWAWACGGFQASVGLLVRL